MDKQTQTELEAAAFRTLVEHLRKRTDVQNIDLMNLAGFCRNCLSKWYRAAAAEKGVDISDDKAREIVYGMPYSEWKAKHRSPSAHCTLLRRAPRKTPRRTWKSPSRNCVRLWPRAWYWATTPCAGSLARKAARPAVRLPCPRGRAHCCWTDMASARPQRGRADRQPEYPAVLTVPRARRGTMTRYLVIYWACSGKFSLSPRFHSAATRRLRNSDGSHFSHNRPAPCRVSHARLAPARNAAHAGVHSGDYGARPGCHA